MIIFYDERLNIISFPIADFFSLEWTDAWTEPGEWSLALPRKYIDTVMRSAYIYADGIGFGIVEKMGFTQDSLKTGGRSLEALLDSYAVTQERSITGKAEDAGRTLITQYAPQIRLEESKGYKNAVAHTISPGSLMDAEYALLNPRGMSYRLTIDDGNITFHTVKGENRTNRQTKRPWVQFSTGLKNLVSPSFEKNTRDEKTRVILRNSTEKDDVVTTTLHTYDFG